MKYKYLIIDMSNLFWRCVVKSSDNFLTIEGHEIYNFVIQNVLERIKELRERFGYDDSKLYFLLDNSQSKINIRKILDSEYKHSREYKNVPKHLYSTLNFFIEILKCYSDDFYFVNEDGFEADDLTLPIKEYLYDVHRDDIGDNFLLFISNDLDWARNIDIYCHFFNFYNLYTVQSFKEKYKFSPEGKNIQIYKTLKGDKSDNIQIPIPYLPEEVVLYIIETYNNIDHFYRNLMNDKDISDKWCKRFLEEEEQIRKNWNLVDFILLDKNVEKIIFKCKENIKKLRFWFDLLKIPYESRMVDVEKDKNILFKKRMLPRV